jgi:hypothetical protein
MVCPQHPAPGSSLMVEDTQMSDRNESLTLYADSIRFFSKLDEYAFADWLRTIPGFVGMNLVGTALEIEFALPAGDDCVREIIALFYRYKIDMRQLAQLENAANSKWMRSKNYYWATQVFPV